MKAFDNGCFYSVQLTQLNTTNTMTAYESIRYEDLRQRVQVRNEVLTEKEQRQLNHLDAIARKEWENQEAPRFLGGNYPDL